MSGGRSVRVAVIVITVGVINIIIFRGQSIGVVRIGGLIRINVESVQDIDRAIAPRVMQLEEQYGSLEELYRKIRHNEQQERDKELQIESLMAELRDLLWTPPQRSAQHQATKARINEIKSTRRRFEGKIRVSLPKTSSSLMVKELRVSRFTSRSATMMPHRNQTERIA